MRLLKQSGSLSVRLRYLKKWAQKVSTKLSQGQLCVYFWVNRRYTGCFDAKYRIDDLLHYSPTCKHLLFLSEFLVVTIITGYLITENFNMPQKLKQNIISKHNMPTLILRITFLNCAYFTWFLKVYLTLISGKDEIETQLVIIISYELMNKRQEELIRHVHPNVAILDESHHIKAFWHLF